MIVLRLFDSPLADGSIGLYKHNQQLHFCPGFEALKQFEKEIIYILLPGSWLSLYQVEIPTKNSQELKLALPGALEEHVAQDIESLHLAHGNMQEHFKYPVLVIEKQKMDSIFAPLEGLNIKLITSEILALPYHEGKYTLLLEQDWIMVRSGLYQGLAIERDMFNFWLENLEEPLEYIIYHCGGEAIALDNAEIIQGESLDILEQGLTQSHTINLLQGSYSPQHKWQQSLQIWRGAAILLMIYFISIALASFIELYQIKAKNKLLQAQEKAIFQQTFPEIKNIVNPRAQMKNKLQALKDQQISTGSNFLILLQYFAQQADLKTIDILNVNFRNQSLDLEINIQNLQLLDALKEKLNQDYKAEIQTATSQQNAVKARLRLEEKK